MVTTKAFATPKCTIPSFRLLDYEVLREQNWMYSVAVTILNTYPNIHQTYNTIRHLVVHAVPLCVKNEKNKYQNRQSIEYTKASNRTSDASTYKRTDPSIHSVPLTYSRPKLSMHQILNYNTLNFVLDYWNIWMW